MKKTINNLRTSGFIVNFVRLNYPDSSKRAV